MNDRLSPPNGKRHVFWGTLRTCPICGRCLCYGCHPQGPCLDEREAALSIQPATPVISCPAQTSHA
jgi:hypothetical protein